MPSQFRSPKALTDWLELDYYRRPRGFRRWRVWANWLAIFACVGLIGYYFVFHRNPQVFQAGPISTAHQFLADKCDACHRDAFQPANRLLTGRADVRSTPDDACVRCHPGPLHHPQMETSKVGTCASCHREHRGSAVLSKVADSQCTHCHADLKRQDGVTTALTNVTSFDAQGHPDFQIYTKKGGKDTSQLKFNHARHMDPTRMKREMDCSQCHEADSEGRYMKAIKYEKHCADCHPLIVGIQGSFADQDVSHAQEAYSKRPAQHREPRVVRAELRQRLVEFIQTNPKALGSARGTEVRPIPGRTRPPGVTKEQWSWVDEQLAVGERMLFDKAGGCVWCHVETTNPASRPDGGLPQYALTNVPDRWLNHSLFKHSRHRMLECKACHVIGGDAGKPVTTSQATSDVLLPNMKSCQTCHNASKLARNDCQECHLYHARDAKASLNGSFDLEDVVHWGSTPTTNKALPKSSASP